MLFLFFIFPHEKKRHIDAFFNIHFISLQSFLKKTTVSAIVTNINSTKNTNSFVNLCNIQSNNAIVVNKKIPVFFLFILCYNGFRC